MLTLPATAQSDRELAQQDEIDELKRQLAVVVDELQGVKSQLGVPEEPELKSTYGLGPAASKVYGASQGLSIGGYAEGVYRNRGFDSSGDGDDFADFVRAVLYVGYKFTDKLIFNTELEFEHASTDGDGSVSVEFAALEYLHRPELNLRAGLLLAPMGLVNEIHEPPFYLGTQRPEVELRIIPSTWRENGMGIFGTLGERLSYRVYVMNGLDAAGFRDSGLRGGRQRGSEALAEDLAGVVRVDFDVVDGLMVGGSYYQGNSGQDQVLPVTSAKLPHVRTRIWEAHADYRRGPFQARALWAEADLSDAGTLSGLLTAELGTPVAVADEMIGGYAEVGYDLLDRLAPDSTMSLIPFFRFEYLDTQHELSPGLVRNRSVPRRLFIPGIHWKPHPSVVLKLDYRNIDNWDGSAGDELSMGFGLVF